MGVQRAHPGLPGRRGRPLLPGGPLLRGVAIKVLRGAALGLRSQTGMQALIAKQAASLQDQAWLTQSQTGMQAQIAQQAASLPGQAALITNMARWSAQTPGHPSKADMELGQLVKRRAVVHAMQWCPAYHCDI